MANVPQDIYNAVKPFVNCPDPIWEAIVYIESNFNPSAIGDGPQQGGYSYGLFQLHVGNTGYSGQGNTALKLIQDRTGLTGQFAITYLLGHPEIQAEVGMSAINSAWNNLKNSYTNANDREWWTSFCIQSGHPGGSSTNPNTLAYVDNLYRKVINPNLFGIQQLSQTTTAIASIDNTWLQDLINMPPHQPCSIIWRRSCPGAKNALEGGMDLTSPNGTKVYSLADGVVIGAGYFFHPNGNPGYGVVTVRSTLPDGSVADIYYQHIQLSTAIFLCGQTGGQLYNNVIGPAPINQGIKKGQFLGTVIVGEVEVGINAEWGGIWGTNHPGPWLDDPEDVIRSLMNNGGGASNTQFPVSTGNNTLDTYLSSAFNTTHESVQTLTQIPGIAGPIQVFHDAQQFKPFVIPDDNSSSKNWPIWGGIEQGASYPSRVMLGIINFVLNNTLAFMVRTIFVLISLVIIVALIINIISKTEETETGNLLPLAEAAL